MCRFLVLFSVIATAFAATNPKFGDVEAKVFFVDDISKLDLSGADIIPLEESPQQLGTIRYTIGNRQVGDRIVATVSDRSYWSTPQDVQLKLNYPSQGIGAVITYTEIVVDQSSSSGRGYIIGGGIGQRSISIVIEAHSTTHFIYSGAFYGV